MLFFLISICSGLRAQEVVATAGNTLGNSSGSIAYTIGEGVAQTFTVGDKTLTQGFHQTIISVKIISELKDPDFAVSVFPNPASDVLTLRLTKGNIQGLQYFLYDINGILISQKNLESDETSVAVDQLANGIYIIKVQDGRKELKSFKIIKE